MRVTTTVLGRGANSVVLLGHRDDAAYAVKVLGRSDTGPQGVAVRREAAWLASIEHPGLVRVHEVGETTGRPYVVTDHVDGKSRHRPPTRAGTVGRPSRSDRRHTGHALRALIPALAPVLVDARPQG